MPIPANAVIMQPIGYQTPMPAQMVDWRNMAPHPMGVVFMQPGANLTFPMHGPLVEENSEQLFAEETLVEEQEDEEEAEEYEEQRPVVSRLVEEDEDEEEEDEEEEEDDEEEVEEE